jgi:hypothetical protein
MKVDPAWNHSRPIALSADIGGLSMQLFVGIILGMLLLTGAVFVSDSLQTSAVANGQTAQASRTMVNWDVVADDWHALKTRAHDDWVRISSK